MAPEAPDAPDPSGPLGTLIRRALTLSLASAGPWIGILALAHGPSVALELAAEWQALTAASQGLLFLVAVLIAGAGSLALAQAILARIDGKHPSIRAAYLFVLDHLGGYLGLIGLMIAIALGVGLVGLTVGGALAAAGLGPIQWVPLALAAGIMGIGLLAAPLAFVDVQSAPLAVRQSVSLARTQSVPLLVGLALIAAPYAGLIGLAGASPESPTFRIGQLLVAVVYTPFPMAYIGLVYRGAFPPTTPDPPEGNRA